MKTSLSSLLTILVCGSIVLMTGCRANVVANSCEKNSKDVSAAAQAWSSDFSNKTKCEAYKNALSSFVNSSCFNTYGTAAERKTFQSELQNMKCN